MRAIRIILIYSRPVDIEQHSYEWFSWEYFQAATKKSCFWDICGSFMIDLGRLAADGQPSLSSESPSALILCVRSLPASRETSESQILSEYLIFVVVVNSKPDEFVILSIWFSSSCCSRCSHLEITNCTNDLNPNWDSIFYLYQFDKQKALCYLLKWIDIESTRLKRLFIIRQDA